MKSEPLAEDPIFVPPVVTVYQFIVFPADVAFRLELLPQVIVEGVAITFVAGKGVVQDV